MKKYLIFYIIGMMYSNASYANLLETLQKYCVPKDGSGCSAGVKATYDSRSGNCVCNSNSKRYNINSRACEDCITGSYASSDYKSCEPIVCPAGYHVVLVQNGACPSGYGLRQVANGGCPSGYGLRSYNVVNKRWN